MAILATFTVHGATQQLLDAYDRAMPQIVATATAKPLSHVCVPSEEGIRIYDVWDSQETLNDFASNPKFGEALAKAGLPTPEVDVVAAHRFNW